MLDFGLSLRRATMSTTGMTLVLERLQGRYCRYCRYTEYQSEICTSLRMPRERMGGLLPRW